MEDHDTNLGEMVNGNPDVPLLHNAGDEAIPSDNGETEVNADAQLINNIDVNDPSVVNNVFT